MEAFLEIIYEFFRCFCYGVFVNIIFMYLQSHYNVIKSEGKHNQNFMANLQIRIDEKLKNDSKIILESMGLDLSSAVKIFLMQVVIHKSIPFEIKTPNGFTQQAEKVIKKAAKEAAKGKNVTKFKSAAESIKWLEKQ